MSDFAQHFRDLADRFLRLRGDNLADADADFHARRLAIKAAKLAHEAGDVLKLNPGIPWPTERHASAVADDLAWRTAWAVVCVTITGEVGVTRRLSSRKGVSVSVSTREDWREQCEEWGAVCRRLADMVAEPADDTPCMVTLLQIASIVNRSKRTLEGYTKKMPMPVVEGGGGKPAEWEWDTIRPWLEKEFGRKLDAVFPGDRFRRS
jgi:hypothetical protein